MLASPLHSTIESELSLLVYFSRPTEEENVSFGIVVLKVMRANGVEELDQEVALLEEGD